ncbi:MAG: hypothetical protein A3G49_05735 [Candidatus Sungbacteria bacterium RIFCSPLOWO2_12_FULL_41_11]|uniref:Uncharacterized protein n=1 Tax=Candidatus Sungbacteria bacterium RIFCSPLOWO2_12_FULL_41_11 TaxID=1802286 RepID=A0A1G2LUV3_9BACT|nr:MAG: hypothetical protein A3G49_05735 [Candidatus Sungbacteria bacterium RIFCSPLOWO2_12_FULL_41_11]
MFILNHLFISRNRLRLTFALSEDYSKTWCWVNFVLRNSFLRQARDELRTKLKKIMPRLTRLF